MRSWICVVGLLLCTLGWPLSADAQSITLSSPSSTYQAPATFGLTIAVTNGTGTNKYRIDTSTITFFRNNQSVHFGTTSFTETNLPVGTYSYRATATAYHTVTLHEYTVQSNTVNITVTAPPAPTGTVTATPNPCNIAMGSTTCATTISWNSTNSSASVWVTDLSNNGAQLFANGQSGAQAATWITAAGARFHLKVGSQTLSTVDVLGNPPPPPSGTISGSPNPCTIAPGNTSCNITINWSSVNAPTAEVWASDLSNNGMTPFWSAPSGSQAMVMPASTAKRMHLKFGEFTLATVDIQAGALPPPSGTITASPGTCDVAPGSATCPATISWNTYNATAKVSIRMTDLNGNEEEPFAAGPIGTKSVPIVAPGMRFHLKNGSQLLATVDVHGNPPPLQPSVPYRASKTETLEYHNDPSKWVMGQVKRSLINGTEVSRTTFDTTTVLPLQSYAFGKLQQTLSYYADGNLATFKDGNNNVTTLGNWYRGVPRTIQYPATPEVPSGATQTAVVNDKGWITAVTDENGFTTSYGHDAMGRLASIVYPAGDSTTWNTVTMAFQRINSDEHGLPAGHWRASRYEGNKHINTYYDGMWRPVLEEQLDAANIAGTVSQVVKRYDVSGRLAFQSYPANNVTDFQATTQGTRTFYDALNRVTRVEQDSELGVLASTTEYQTSFKTLATNPRGYKTLTLYAAYDQPTYDWPVTINQVDSTVDNASTDIVRDVFGKPTAIRRRNADGSLGVWRHYVYDGYQQLCKTIEPETGATVMDYDGAGNLQWSAAGTALTSTNSCDTIAGRDSGRKVTRYYDARSRLTSLEFPDGRGNQIWSYNPDGLPGTITTWNGLGGDGPVINAYTYNKRRMLIGESVQQPGWYGWGIGYGYDANGSLASQTYPTGLVVNYSPNALGQATAVTSTDGWTYASGVQYYPNGVIKQFTYGNGLTHNMAQNARQLPQRVTDGGNALDHEYTYDSNGNVSAIFDYIIGAPTAQHRYMTYDGLDRLTGAGSAMFGGSDHWHFFTYNALDNLTSWKQAGVKDYAEYVYTNNRLTNIKNSAGATVVGLEYDVQGNLANKNGQTYAFDHGNRLRETTDKEWYRYDGHGRRVLNWRWNEAGVLSQYSQSGQLLYDENYRASGRKATEYVYLAGSVITTRERNIDTNTWTVSFQHTDALGSPVAVTSTAGAVTDRTNYEPYGAAINKPAYDGIGYTGHVMDGATGLTYMQQRYYDPDSGRFLSTDPVQANPNTGASFNRYVYASNNPYKNIDPDGRSDVNYFHGTDVLNDAAERFDIPGFTTVMGHSTAKDYRDDREFKPGTEVGYDSLKSDISSTFKRNDYIFLGGCSLGFRNTPERLAKDFNTSVVAATGYVRRSESSNGDITYSVNSRTDGKGVAGSFRIARPDGSSSGKIASVTMRADGKVTFKAAEAPLGSRIKPTVTVDPNRR